MPYELISCEFAGWGEDVSHGGGEKGGLNVWGEWGLPFLRTGGGYNNRRGGVGGGHRSRRVERERVGGEMVVVDG